MEGQNSSLKSNEITDYQTNKQLKMITSFCVNEQEKTSLEFYVKV